MRDNQITTLVDLRLDEEVVRRPCPLAALEDFRYVNLPVTGGGDTSKSREYLHVVYGQMLDEQMEKIMDTIMNAKTNVMYCCTAGKDRTGMVSAVILKHLGFSDEIIVDDSMKSKDNLREMLTAYVKEHSEVDIDIIVPKEENMERVLEKLQGLPASKRTPVL